MISSVEKILTNWIDTGDSMLKGMMLLPKNQVFKARKSIIQKLKLNLANSSMMLIAISNQFILQRALGICTFATNAKGTTQLKMPLKN